MSRINSFVGRRNWVKENKLKIVGAYYDLNTGRVEILKDKAEKV